MSKPKGKDKDAKKEEVKQEPPPVREKVKLTDNLPKVPIKTRIQQIRRVMQTNSGIIQKYTPQQKTVKYQKNFKLFDRNNDQLLTYQQAKQFLISIGQMINEQDLKQFYKQLSVSKPDNPDGPSQGIRYQKMLQIVIEKMRQQDPQQQLTEAFNIVLDGSDKTFIESDDFKEYLMTMGYKWPEDMADQFIKEFQPKSEKKITPADVIKKLMKR